MNPGKYSPRARQAAAQAAAQAARAASAAADPAGGPAECVGVLLSVRAPLQPPELAELESLGARVRGAAGDVLTAQVPLDQLARLGDLEFVRYVEVSSPLHPEGGPPS